MLAALLMLLLFLSSVFLMILILIQRGRGGGLAGAFGGLGGQSAFGTKAGDLFTNITIGAAVVWMVLCVASVRVFTSSGDMLESLGGNAPSRTAPNTSKAPGTPGDQPASTPPAEGGSPAGSSAPASTPQPSGSDPATP